MQKKDKNSEFLYFYFLNMSKKNLTVLFLLLSGVIAVLAYAGGKQSNWLSDGQINFAKDNLSTDRGNKLEAQLRDAVVNGLTTRAQNHEKRLQAFAQSTGYPNLTPEQTSFSDLLSTKHSNQLTADMRNGLLTRLTYAVTNHEMRLRKLQGTSPTSGNNNTTTIVAWHCFIKPEVWGNCVISNPEEFGANINKTHSSFIQIKKAPGWYSAGDTIYFGYKQGGSLSFPSWYDEKLNFIDLDSRIRPLDGKIKRGKDYELYARLAGAGRDSVVIPHWFDPSTSDVYKKIVWAHPESDATEACKKYCNKLECSCSDRILDAKCKWNYFSTSRRNEQKEICEKQTDEKSCKRRYNCQWIDIP